MLLLLGRPVDSNTIGMETPGVEGEQPPAARVLGETPTCWLLLLSFDWVRFRTAIIRGVVLARCHEQAACSDSDGFGSVIQSGSIFDSISFTLGLRPLAVLPFAMSAISSARFKYLFALK